MELGKYILYIHKKLKGDLNAEEKDSLDRWTAEEDHAEVERDLHRIWSASGSYKKDFTPDIDKSWNAFSDKINAEKENQSKNRLRVAGRRMRRLAAALILLIGATFVWQNINNPLDVSGDGLVTPGEVLREVNVPADQLVVVPSGNAVIAPASRK